MPADFTSGSVAVEDAPDFSNQSVAVEETKPSPPVAYEPIAGSSEVMFMPGGSELEGPKFPRVGFTPKPDDNEPVGKIFGLPETITASMTKGGARKAGAILANAGLYAGETALDPSTVPIIAAAAAAPEVVIPILTATMAKSGSTKLAEGITDLEQGRHSEGVAKIGEAGTELLFAASPALHPSGFAQPGEPGIVGRAGEGIGRTIAPLIPEGTAEVLAPRTIAALKPFVPAKVQAGERAGIETAPRTTAAVEAMRPAPVAPLAKAPLTEALKPVQAVEEIEPFGAVRQFRVTQEFVNPADEGTYKVGDIITEPQLTRAGLPVPEPTAEVPPTAEPPKQSAPPPEAKAEQGTLAYEWLDEPTGEWRQEQQPIVVSRSTIPGDKPWRATVFGGPKDSPVPVAHVQMDLPSEVNSQAVITQLAEQLGRYVRNIKVETVPPEAPAAAPAEPAGAPEAKQPWQMTQAEATRAELNTRKDLYDRWKSATGQMKGTHKAQLEAADRELAEYRDQHKSDVAKALREGKPVPPEVLADYPDLAPKPAPEPTAPAQIPIENVAKIAELNRQLAKEQKALDKNVAKMGSMVPPPIVAEITRKISTRMAKIQDQIDALEKPIQTPPAAVAKAQAEVTKVAQTEGTRSAKDIKAELVARLEQAVKDAPTKADAYVGLGLGGKAPVPTVKIEIPGDGTFNLVNTKENISEVLRQAKGLATSAKTPVPKVKVPRVGDIADQAEAAAKAYGSPEKAYQSVKRQIEQLQEAEPPASAEDRKALSDQIEGAEHLLREIYGNTSPGKLEAQAEATRYRVATYKEGATGFETEIARLEKLKRPNASIKERLADLKERYAQNQDFIRTNEANAEKWEQQAAKEKVALEAKPPTEPPGEGPESGPAESRIRPSAEPADIFSMDEGDLRDLLSDRFPEPPKPTTEALEARRPGAFEFPSYTDFKTWMDARYAEFDHEGMRLAFAEAPTANKVAYIKDNLAADVHKKAWITNLATGAVLPTTNPPVARTTPRPMPGGTVTGTTPAGPPAHQQPPPPPPRAPSIHPKFDITALVQLLRQFDKFPVMNERLRRAYGRFIPDKELVELKQRLLWDNDLAERVLGHEIGHFIDLIIPLIGKGKQFGERLRLLTDFTGQMWKAKELRNDAKSLSRQWRGPFANGDKYRDTAKELMADFMSAMLHDPEWVNQNYPRLYDSFSEFRTAKPQFDTAYREIETWLQGGTVAQELIVQDRAAVERTFDIINRKPEISKATIADRMSQSLISLWNRAFQKEGKPRRIGESITEKLETSYMWAAKQLSLWSDRYTKEVQPHIDRLSNDPIEAHTDLLAYSKAVRTIGERRAAGVWIEQNPVEARTMLEHLLGLDDGLRSKFSQALANAPDTALYDLSAAIFREIHDRGERFVARMSREIDSLDLGVEGDAALIAFNVRGKLLNPGGQSVPNSNRMIEHLRDKLGPQKFAELESGARALRGLMHEVQREMYDAGLISKKAWENLIAPNVDNYLPYAVLDYFDGRVKAGIMPQIGTAKDVADVSAAVQLKVASAYLWLQKQRQVQLLRDIESNLVGGPLPLGDALRRASEIDVIRVKGQNKNDATSRAVLWVDGKPHVVEFPNDPGKLYEKALELPEFYQHMEWLHATSRFTHRMMQVFTQLSPRFLFYRNVVRGFRTAGLKVGYLRAAQQMAPTNFIRNLALAKNYAESAFGKPMLPEVRRMVELEALPPPQLASGAVRDLPNQRELLVRGSLPVFSARRLAELLPEQQSKLSKAWHAVSEPMQMVFTTYEAFEKIYNYRAAMEKGLGEQTAAAIAKRGGIPRPGVSGKWSSAIEVLFPWTRVRTQGIRASYQMFRDPRFGKAFATRFAVFEALPRIAKVLVGMGLASKAILWLMRKDEDKDDPVWGEVARRVSPYKMALDDVVPLAFYDTRTGQYHPFWEFKAGKDVPAHFEVVSLRLPASEEGQTFGAAFYQTLVSTPGIKEQLGRPGQGITEAVTAAGEAIGPQLSPVITTTHSLMQMILSGRNPPDPWSGNPSANQLMFDAGGVDRAQAVAGYLMNKSGGPGELAAVLAANVGLLDERARQALSYRLSSDKRPWTEKYPFLSAVVAHDNYARYRDEKTAELDEVKLRARARLLMPPELTSIYDFYYRNLNRKDKLDEFDQRRFDISSYFVNSIWGHLGKDDSFYGRAAHSISKDGSKESKETFKRDLMSVTEGIRELWNTPE